MCRVLRIHSTMSVSILPRTADQDGTIHRRYNAGTGTVILNILLKVIQCMLPETFVGCLFILMLESLDFMRLSKVVGLEVARMCCCCCRHCRAFAPRCLAGHQSSLHFGRRSNLGCFPVRNSHLRVHRCFHIDCRTEAADNFAVGCTRRHPQEV